MFQLATSVSHAGDIFDNFEDGNADGWWLGYSQHTPWVPGNWRVESGELVQDMAGDDFIALFNSDNLSDQIIEADIKLKGPSGYGGVTIWFQNDSNYLNVYIYPAAGEVWVSEKIDGSGNLTRYPFVLTQSNEFHNLRVETNNENGTLDVYIDDVFIFTHTIITSNRDGKSGLNNGNAGGYFDNFMISSSSIVDPLVNKDQRKNKGWKQYFFKNQGSCASFLERSEK